MNCDFPSIFIRFWPCEPHFLINFFLIKKGVLHHAREDGDLLIFITKCDKTWVGLFWSVMSHFF